MKGEFAFCPKSGAPLSEDVHYDEFGRPKRHGVRDDHPAKTQPDGELTNGALRSSRVAVFNHFRRCHRRHRECDGQLYSKAALGLTRLKQTASGTEEWDVMIWYALGEWLSRSGYDASWMNAHAEPRCPGCGGKLKYERLGDDSLVARCGVDCSGDGSDRLAELRETVADLYARAFPDADAVDSDELRLL